MTGTRLLYHSLVLHSRSLSLRDVLYRLTHSLVSSSTVLNEVSLDTCYLLNIGLPILLDRLEAAARVLMYTGS
jgi:hypothetical protein